jgi:hypothetical protein
MEKIIAEIHAVMCKGGQTPAPELPIKADASMIAACRRYNQGDKDAIKRYGRHLRLQQGRGHNTK